MAGNLLELNKDNFEQEVLKSQIPVIVDFWATWCMPCKMMAPAVEQIGIKYAGRCKVAKLNIDNSMELATRFGVMNIPTIIFFKSGSEFSRVAGVVSKEAISSKIDEMLA